MQGKSVGSSLLLFVGSQAAPRDGAASATQRSALGRRISPPPSIPPPQAPAASPLPTPTVRGRKGTGTRTVRCRFRQRGPRSRRAATGRRSTPRRPPGEASTGATVRSRLFPVRSIAASHAEVVRASLPGTRHGRAERPGARDDENTSRHRPIAALQASQARRRPMTCSRVERPRSKAGLACPCRSPVS